MSSERIDKSGTDAGAAGGRPAQRTGNDKQSDDPEAIVAEIERTRDDLAETLDEIADRVSPKRVANRSKQKAREIVAEKSAQAREIVAEKSAQAREIVAEKSAQAKEKAVTAQAAVNEKTAQARGAVADKVGSGSGGPTSDASSVRLDPSATQAQRGTGSSAGGADVGALPPVTAVPVPELAPERGSPATQPLVSGTTPGGGGAQATPSRSTGAAASTWVSENPALTKELAAGAAAALLGLWLLRRRRS